MLFQGGNQYGKATKKDEANSKKTKWGFTRRYLRVGSQQT